MRTLTGNAPVTKGIIGYGIRNHSYHKKQAIQGAQVSPIQTPVPSVQ